MIPAFVWMISTSFRVRVKCSLSAAVDTHQLLANIFKRGTRALPRYFFNSVVVALAVTLGDLFTAPSPPTPSPA